MGMEKYAKTIIPTIEANYERYTETERHIADYFLKNDAIGDLSAEFISTELSVHLRRCQDLPRKADIRVTGNLCMNTVILMWRKPQWNRKSRG